MKVEKLYQLACYGFNDFYETEFFTSKEECLSELQNFKENILEEDENMEELDTTIELYEIYLDDVEDIDDYANKKTISIWSKMNDDDDDDADDDNGFYYWEDLK